MANILQVGNGYVTRAVTSAALYFRPANAVAFLTATESQAQITYSSAGMLSNLYVKVTANTWTVNCTFSVRKNGSSDGINESITILAGTAGEFEDTDSDAITADDEVCYRLVMPAGSGSITIGCWNILFAATSNTVGRYGGGIRTDSVNANFYFPIAGAGSGGGNTTRVNVQFEVNSSCTAQNLQVNVTANTRTLDTVFNFEIDAVVGNQSITVAGGVTGIVIDTGTDALISGNLINYWVDMGAEVTVVISFILSIEISSTNSTFYSIAGTFDNIATTLGPGLTRFNSVGGYLNYQATEDNTDVEANIAFTTSNLVVYVSINTLTANTTIDLNHDGATTGIGVTYGSGVTGRLEDTDSHAITADEELDYVIVTGATGTAITIRSIGFMGTISAGGLSIPVAMRTYRNRRIA